MDDLIKSKELEFRPIKNFIECIRRSVTEINDFMLYRLTTVSEFGGEEEACKALPKYPKGFIRAASVGDKCLFCGCTEWVYVEVPTDDEPWLWKGLARHDCPMVLYII